MIIENFKNIPKHWRWVTLDDIGIVVSGGTPSTKEPEFWNGDIPWITPADLSNHEEVYISKGGRDISQVGLEYSSAYLLPENSIVFSSRAPIGYVAISKNKLATNQGFKNLILPDSLINPKYVYYYLKTAKDYAENIASGTTFLELSGAKFKQIPIPLTSINEQTSIVNKIEEIFSELDKNIVQLNESKSKTDYIKSKFLDKHIIGNKSDFVKLKKLTKSLTYGYTAKSFKVKKIGSWNYLRITDIQDGKINWENVPFCEISDKDEIEKYKLKKNDIVFARSGNTTGKSILINKPEQSLFASYLIRITCDTNVLNPQFLSYFMQTTFYWKQINEGITGTGQPNFNGTKLGNLEIPQIDIKTQRKLVHIIERNFEEIDNMKQEIDINIKNTLLLKSKILRDAFQGALNIEIHSGQPVEKLLNEIKKEKDIYISEQIEKNKNHKKIERKKINLYENIDNIFKSSKFDFQELSNKIIISRSELEKEFDLLLNNNQLTKIFDEESNSIKYKLI